VNHAQALDLLSRLMRPIAPEVDLAGVDPAAVLQDEADLDSMDFLNLVTALHEEAGIDIPERDYPQVATVSGFVDYIAKASEHATSTSP
jgi:acyl carrier protein